MTTLQLPDDELAGQPAAYWTGVAYESLIAFTRARQADFGFTQPQFWLLRNLSSSDLLSHEGGMTIPELEKTMSSYLRPEDDLADEAENLLKQGWAVRDNKGRLKITDAGEDARLRFKEHAPAIRSLIHNGIDDADYIAALKVLRQLIRNTGGSA
ncbi:MarR family transcriptional regulator [Actinoplanes sp. NPDC049265]|uniref:MarR family transcriptional regulator n=1 Tax=Actinoplanes sp. NPDC049265 TaxID=3363902 RepID=UPI003716C977